MVVPVGDLAIGFATCYDVRFPGLFTTLARPGCAADLPVRVLGMPGPGKVEQWDLLVRARALDSTTFVAACGQADPVTVGVATTGSAPTGVGHSAVISPRGETLAALQGEPGLLFAEVDTAELEAARSAIPVLANGRF